MFESLAFTLEVSPRMETFSAGKGHILIQKSTCYMQMFTDTENEGLMLLLILVILINL